MASYLDKTGLTYLWEQIKELMNWFVYKDVYTKMPLTLVALEECTFTFVGHTDTSTSHTNTLEYSMDGGETWTQLAASASTPTVQAGGKVMWRRYDVTHLSYTQGIGHFSSTGRFEVEGNIMSIQQAENFENLTTISDAQFFGNLFRDASNLVSVQRLSLPATTLTDYCYCRMFLNCTSLVDSPVLKATTLTSHCYENMFYGCSSLVNAPKLPSTTLATGCYYQMFQDCTSLVDIPDLPATTMVQDCYRYMFQGCTALVKAPDLPAKTMATSCYGSMFNGCTNLYEIPELPALTLAQGCYSGMFSGCTSIVSVPVHCLPATTLVRGCYSNMFFNCSSLVNPPELPAKTVVRDCYKFMFYQCTSLVTAPDLPAATLETDCYKKMFYGCTSLKFIKALFTTTPSNAYTDNWVYNVPSGGTFVKSDSATWSVSGVHGVPSGWTIKTASQWSEVKQYQLKTMNGQSLVGNGDIASVPVFECGGQEDRINGTFHSEDDGVYLLQWTIWDDYDNVTYIKALGEKHGDVVIVAGTDSSQDNAWYEWNSQQNRYDKKTSETYYNSGGTDVTSDAADTGRVLTPHNLTETLDEYGLIEITDNTDPQTGDTIHTIQSSAYQKPSGGIPSTDMASAVQTSLGKADSAYQKPSGGIPKTDLAQGVQDSLALADSALQSYVETDPTVPAWAKESSKPTYTASEVGALPDTTKYASSKSVGGAADKTVSIPFGAVDNTSTSTAFTATIDGITELRDGVCVYLRNNKVTSAAGCTLNINGLGAKPICQSMNNTTNVGGWFSINYTMLFVYNSTRVTGGCWDMYMGFYSDSNSIGYDVREYYLGSKKVKAVNGRYMLFFTCADGMLLPVNSENNVTTPTHTLTTESFNPFGEIYYYNSSSIMAAGGTVGNATLCSQLTNGSIDLRYSFNTADTLVAGNDVYLVCVIQTDGQVKLAPNPIVFRLPQHEDGLIYKRLGKCYSTTQIILEQHKPCYYYKDGAIRLWTNESDFLSNGAVIEEDFLSRETHRDAIAQVKGVKGRTIIWNQWMDTSKTFTGSHATLSYSNGVYSIATSNDSSTWWSMYNNPYYAFVTGHKVYLSVDVIDNSIDYKIYFSIGGGNTSGQPYNYKSGRYSVITSITNSTATTFGIYGNKDANGESKTASFTNIRVVDLTAMFGTGNEPSIEEFEAMFTEESYSYNAGEVLNVAMTGLKTKDASATDLDSVSLDVTQITSNNVAIFPNGLNGIGDVRDEIDFTTGKAVKRIGVVDMGSMNYIYVANGAYFWTDDIKTLVKMRDSNTGKDNLLSKIYTTDDQAYIDIVHTTRDKLVTVIWSTSSAAGRLYLNNSSYSDKDTFKTAMSGEYLYYELATPVEYTIDPVSIDTLDTVNGGEEIVLPVGTGKPGVAPAGIKEQLKSSLMSRIESLEARVLAIENS